jgi:hypothetical protein
LGQKALALYKPGFSTVTLMLPNNIVTHGVQLGIITGSKGVAAALKEGVAPHVKIVKRDGSGTQAIVRLLEIVTQQRHSALK